MRKVLAEFKKFALKGSVVDLAVGIIIGAGFNMVVQSLVKDIITPPIGFFAGRVDFAELYINLSGREFETFQEAQAAGVPTINYGIFLNALLSFLITAFVVFLIVKLINRLREQQEKAPETTPSTKPCPFCVSIIPLKAVRCPQCTSDLSASSL